jgi:hypothetical protein
MPVQETNHVGNGTGARLRNKGILALAFFLCLTGCGFLYRTAPETVTAGVITNPEHIRADQSLVTVTGTWRVKPAPPPQLPPSWNE